MAQQEEGGPETLLMMWNCLKLGSDGVGIINGSNYPQHNRDLNRNRGRCCPGCEVVVVPLPGAGVNSCPHCGRCALEKAPRCHQVKEMWKEVSRLRSIRGRWWSLEKQKRLCAELTWYFGRFIVCWGVRSRIPQNIYKGPSNMGTVTPCGHLGCYQK